MKKSEFSKSIRNVFTLLSEIDYVFQAGTVDSFNPSGEFKRASLRSASYRELYDVAVTRQDFNIMMSDKSFFQFTLKKEYEELRLAYYPNPYHFIEYQNERRAAKELLDRGDLSQDEYEQLLSESDISIDIPVIRYDYSLAQYDVQFHPAAHFHIGFFVENRWPSRRMLTPYAFALKILVHYYSHLWRSGKKLDDGFREKLDAKYRTEVKKCGLLPLQHFSGIEFERLYFS